MDFVQNDLGEALRDYDARRTVQQRQAALQAGPRGPRVARPAEQGQQSQGRTWQPSLELEAAMNDLFNRPNLDITADVATVAPVFEANLVQTGPVTRKGYTSMVTAGPKTGFGLLPQRRRHRVLQQPDHGQRHADLGLPAADRPGPAGPARRPSSMSSTPRPTTGPS